MKPKFALIITLLLAFLVVAPISASARHRRVHFSVTFGSVPSYYYQSAPGYYYYPPAPTYYYEPAPTYYYYQPVPRYRYYRWEPREHGDRGRHLGWYKHGDRDRD